MKNKLILLLSVIMIFAMLVGCDSGSEIKDGTYSITVESSSSMFNIVDCQLTVTDGEMTAVMTLSGTGYSKLYMGTGEEALQDTDDA
jgi:ABC-type proline/glycine betaine transport system ATPase subunit